MVRTTVKLHGCAPRDPCLHDFTALAADRRNMAKRIGVRSGVSDLEDTVAATDSLPLNVQPWRRKRGSAKERRITFSIERNVDIPLKIFSDLLRIGGGMGIKGKMSPSAGNVDNTHFNVICEGTSADLQRYWNYVELVSVVIGDVSDVEGSDAHPPFVQASAEDGNFVVQYMVRLGAPETAEAAEDYDGVEISDVAAAAECVAQGTEVGGTYTQLARAASMLNVGGMAMPEAGKRKVPSSKNTPEKCAKSLEAAKADMGKSETVGGNASKGEAWKGARPKEAENSKMKQPQGCAKSTMESATVAVGKLKPRMDSKSKGECFTSEKPTAETIKPECVQRRKVALSDEEIAVKLSTENMLAESQPLEYDDDDQDEESQSILSREWRNRYDM